jgi:lysophospholipase L1-like esterase
MPRERRSKYANDAKDTVGIASQVESLSSSLAQKAAKDDVFSMVNMGQDIKEAMTGGSVAVVGVNAVLSKNIVNKQVTPEKTNFIKKSLNLFNKNDSRNVTGKMIIYDGSSIDFSEGTISHPIDIISNTVVTGYFDYTTYGGSALAYFFDANDTYLTSIAPVFNGEVGTITVPNNPNITYMKFNVKNPKLHTVMLSVGNTYPNDYVPYSLQLADDFILNESQKNSIILETNNIGDYQVTARKTDFLEPTKNLFNKSDVRNMSGKMINYDASVIDLSDSSISHPIEISPNDVITGYFNNSYYGGSGVAFLYDEDDTYIAQVAPVNNGEIGTVTIPNNPAIAYMKFNFVTAIADSIMIVKDSAYPDTYIPYTYQLSNDILLNESHIDQLRANFDIHSPLYSKVAVFDGDSICNAINDSQDGWAGRIATKNNMTYTNYAVDGATITGGLMADSNPRHWISRSVSSMRSDADYIVFEGGTNDADLLGVGNMGTISNGYNAVLDDTTFSGALESTFKQAILKFPGKKIGYIVAHKMGTGAQADNRKAFFDRVIQICIKWGIPYINLWDESYLNPNITEVNNTYYSDGQHLLSAGYDVIAPKIEAWMKTL